MSNVIMNNNICLLISGYRSGESQQILLLRMFRFWLFIYFWFCICLFLLFVSLFSYFRNFCAILSPAFISNYWNYSCMFLCPPQKEYTSHGENE